MMTIHNTNNDDDGDSSHDLNGDNEDVTISADDCRASSCNMSVSMDWAGPSVLRGRPSGAAPAVHAALSRAQSCADHHRDLKPPQIFTSPIDVLNACFFLKHKIQPGLNIVFLEEAGIGLLSGLELQFISHAVACKLKQRDIVSV